VLGSALGHLNRMRNHSQNNQHGKGIRSPTRFFRTLLSEDETRNSLAIVRATFKKPENIQPTAKEPSRTLQLLRHLADITDPGNLKREIDETITYFQAR
jgi:hypothetical protein